MKPEEKAYQEAQDKKQQEKDAKEARKEKFMKKENEGEMLIRIMSTDIPSNKNVYSGLTRIRGISWSFSNAICQTLKIDKSKKIKDLTESDIEKITHFIQNPKVPLYMLNRRKDIETGENKHITGTDVKMNEEFDRKRLKKMRCYKGLRHALGQPVRGQRTKSHFRKNRTLGVTKAKPAAK